MKPCARHISIGSTNRYLPNLDPWIRCLRNSRVVSTAEGSKGQGETVTPASTRAAEENKPGLSQPFSLNQTGTILRRHLAHFYAAVDTTDAPTKRGTVFHENFHGEKAVPFIDDGHLNLHVWRKEDAGGVDGDVRYGIAVTIEAEGAIPIYDQIAQRLRIMPRP